MGVVQEWANKACANRLGSGLVLTWFWLDTDLVRLILGLYPPPLGEGSFEEEGLVLGPGGVSTRLRPLRTSERPYFAFNGHFFSNRRTRYHRPV